MRDGSKLSEDRIYKVKLLMVTNGSMEKYKVSLKSGHRKSH